MTPCPCMNQPERCDACKRFIAMQSAPPKKKPKNAHGVLHVRKTDGKGGEHIIEVPANRKQRRAAAARGDQR